jgi:hypothetical protein
MKRLYFLSFILLCSALTTSSVVAMEENAQTCDASCSSSSSSQTNKSNFAPSNNNITTSSHCEEEPQTYDSAYAPSSNINPCNLAPSHKAAAHISPFKLDTIPPVATPQTFNDIKYTYLHLMQQLYLIKQLHLQNQNQSALFSKLTPELIREVAGYLYSDRYSLVALAHTSHASQDILHDLELKSRFFAVAQKLDTRHCCFRTPEGFWRDWTEHRKLDLKLDCFENRARLEKVLLAFMDVWHEIKELDFYCCSIIDFPYTFETLLKLDPQIYPRLRNTTLQLPNLRKLRLSWNRLTPESLKHLFGTTLNFSTVEEVDLSACCIKHLPSSCNHNTLRSLTDINLSDNYLTPGSLDRLFTTIGHIHSIKELKLYRYYITNLPNSFNHNNLKHITKIDFSHNPLNQDSLNRLFKLTAHLPLLREISLFKCGLTTLPAFFNRNNVKYLTRIDLRVNNFSDTEKARILSIFPDAEL